MSLHADLTPEAKALIKRQKRMSTVASMSVSFFLITSIAMLLGMLLLPSIDRPGCGHDMEVYKWERPDVVTPNKKIEKMIPKPKPPTHHPGVKVLTGNSLSPVSISIPQMDVDEAIDYGNVEGLGDHFNGELDFGLGDKSGASFFNQNVKASRIAYVIDYSQSMRGEKDRLMREELTKSIKGLKAGTEYQMIFFAGPAWIAGSQVASTTLIKDEKGKSFEWSTRGTHDFTPKGDKQEPEWLTMSSSAMRKSLDAITNTELIFGTDWRSPVKMALAMKPAPQLIFFMTDGASGGGMDKIVEDLSKEANRTGTMINTVALMEPQAEKHMFKLAEQTGGVFTIVDKNGKSRKVDKVGGKK